MHSFLQSRWGAKCTDVTWKPFSEWQNRCDETKRIVVSNLVPGNESWVSYTEATRCWVGVTACTGLSAPLCSITLIAGKESSGSFVDNSKASMWSCWDSLTSMSLWVCAIDWGTLFFDSVELLRCDFSRLFAIGVLWSSVPAWSADNVRPAI